jgi:hypothetical protein
MSRRALRERVLHLLHSPAASRIYFTLGDIVFNSIGFSLVAGAIALKGSGKSKGKGIDVRAVDMKGGLVASYYRKNRNRLCVPSWAYGTTPEERHSLIHESVHAYFDLLKRNTNAVNEEAVAYVAGLLFHIYDTTGNGTPVQPSWAKKDNVHKEAWALAEKLVTTKSTVLTWYEVFDLRNAIRTDPVYLADDPNDPNDDWNFETEYVNDGVY